MKKEMCVYVHLVPLTMSLVKTSSLEQFSLHLFARSKRDPV